MRKAHGIFDWLFIRSCYRSSFPQSERKPLSIIRSMQKAGKTDVWIYDNRKKRIGFAATINSEQCIMLDYFAVHHDHRNAGHGTDFLQTLDQYYADKALFVEIEYDRTCNQEHSIISRRKDFYLRNGMKEMHVHAKVFGVDMELLGYRCAMDFAAYQRFYREQYSAYAAEHIIAIE